MVGGWVGGWVDVVGMDLLLALRRFAHSLARFLLLRMQCARSFCSDKDDRIGQDRVGRGRGNVRSQNRTGQVRTGKDRTGQDRTGQGRAGQGRSNVRIQDRVSTRGTG